MEFEEYINDSQIGREDSGETISLARVDCVRVTTIACDPDYLQRLIFLGMPKKKNNIPLPKEGVMYVKLLFQRVAIPKEKVFGFELFAIPHITALIAICAYTIKPSLLK